jgi:diguanylate cyclase (GGDEF)-like protein
LDEADKLAKDLGMLNEHAGILVDKGNVMQTQGRLNEALQLLFEAHGAFEKLHDKTQISVTLGEIAGIYSSLGDNSQALEYYGRALTGLNRETDAQSITNLNYNVAAVLVEMGNLDEAERLMTKELASSLKRRDKAMVASIRYRLGLISQKRGWDKTALDYFDGALPEFLHIDDPAAIFNVQAHRAELLGKIDPTAASVAFETARTMLNRIDTPERRMQLHESGAAMYKAMKHYPEAMAELEEWIKADKAKDSQFNRKAITEMQVRFDARTKEIDNALLKSEQERQAAELKASKNGRWLLIVSLGCTVALLGALGFLLVFQVRQKRRYADLALVDELTGAPNRRHILTYAQQQLDSCRSLGTDFTLAVIDLDHFKSINDQCGHDAGDEVLRVFAQACQGELRRGDRLGRLGGEEWLLVMPSAKQEELATVFDRLQTAYQQKRPQIIPGTIAFSFSMGAAQAQAGESFDHLLARADTAMYSAKNTGRNRLVLADTPPIPQSAFEPDG